MLFICLILCSADFLSLLLSNSEKQRKVPALLPGKHHTHFTVMTTVLLITFVSSLQTIGSEENQGLADFGVIQYYGWKKVTIFQLDVDSFENVRFPVRPYHPKSNDGCLRVIIETTQAGNGQQHSIAVA